MSKTVDLNGVEITRRELLAQALESGDYKQARNALATKEGFCCLGVACELYCEHVEDIRGDVTPETNRSFGVAVVYGDGFTHILPPEVREWFGLRDNTGGSSVAGQHDLSYLYDTPGETFTQLAERVRNEGDRFVEPD